MTPTLSICIPNLNMAPWLAASVRSALALVPTEQVEVVVADNASDDGSRDVLQSLGDERGDERLRVHLFDERVPMHTNFNRAVASSRGEWCLVLSADDELLPHFLESFNRAPLHDPRVLTVSQGVQVVGLEPSGLTEFGTSHQVFRGRSSDISRLVPHNPFNLSATAFRRSAFERIGGFSDFYHLDHHFFLRLLLELDGTAHCIGGVGGKYFVARGGTASAMTTSGREFVEKIDIVDDLASRLGGEWKSALFTAFGKGALRALPAQAELYGPVAARRAATLAASRTLGITRWRLWAWCQVLDHPFLLRTRRLTSPSFRRALSPVRRQLGRACRR